MAMRPLLLSIAVGITALGTLQAPAVQANGYSSIRAGTPNTQHRSGYDQRQGGHQRGGGYGQHGHGRHYQPAYTFVPGHWAYGQRGRVWVPDQYVPTGHRYDRGQDTRVIYRPAPQPQPLPGAFYHQRGG